MAFVRVSRLATGAYAALALVDTALAGSDSATARSLRSITKPLLMPALSTVFAFSLDDVEGGGLLRGGTVVAHGFSSLGDIALLSKSEPAFLVGLSSFAGAHVAYTGAFVSAGRPLDDRQALAPVAAATGLFVTLGPAASWAAGHTAPSFRIPVLGYAGLLSTMFAASARLNADLPQSARRKVVAGTALFLLSDSILAAKRFLAHDPPAITEAAVMATYTAGQGLIAAGVIEAVRARSQQDHSGNNHPGQDHPVGTSSS